MKPTGKDGTFMKLGITGQQRLTNSERLWAKREMLSYLRRNKVSEGFSCLAKGADQLFITVLIELKLKFTAVIPCDGYESTFENKHTLGNYRDQKAMANTVIEMCHGVPCEKAFYDAGKKVVDLCDLMFTVWNGQERLGLGGTSDVVRYAQSVGRRVIHFNMHTRKITEL